MAEINTDSGSGGRRKKGQPSRMNLRVDFTPMVDMNMLLITFFMFCTTLASPQVMDIVMPAKTPDIPNYIPPEIIASKTITLLLTGDNNVYYYHGLPDYENPNTLKKANLADNSLRDILLDKNLLITQQVKELKQRKLKKEITEAQFKQELSNIKKSKEGATVVVKPTDKAAYSDLVNTLDEMQICSVVRYAVVDLAEGDHFLLNNMVK